MALDVYFQLDIAHGIVSTATAMLSSAAAQGLSNRQYLRGILDFARAQSVHYGISWPWIESQIVAALSLSHDEIVVSLEERAALVARNVNKS